MSSGLSVRDVVRNGALKALEAPGGTATASGLGRDPCFLGGLRGS